MIKKLKLFFRKNKKMDITLPVHVSDPRLYQKSTKKFVFGKKGKRALEKPSIAELELLCMQLVITKIEDLDKTQKLIIDNVKIK